MPACAAEGLIRKQGGKYWSDDILALREETRTAIIASPVRETLCRIAVRRYDGVRTQPEGVDQVGWFYVQLMADGGTLDQIATISPHGRRTINGYIVKAVRAALRGI